MATLGRGAQGAVEMGHEWWRGVYRYPLPVCRRLQWPPCGEHFSPARLSTGVRSVSLSLLSGAWHRDKKHGQRKPRLQAPLWRKSSSHIPVF